MTKLKMVRWSASTTTAPMGSRTSARRSARSTGPPRQRWVPRTVSAQTRLKQTQQSLRPLPQVQTRQPRQFPDHWVPRRWCAFLKRRSAPNSWPSNSLAVDGPRREGQTQMLKLGHKMLPCRANVPVLRNSVNNEHTQKISVLTHLRGDQRNMTDATNCWNWVGPLQKILTRTGAVPGLIRSDCHPA